MSAGRTRLFAAPTVSATWPAGLKVGECAGPQRCDLQHYARHRQQLKHMGRQALLAVLTKALDRIQELEQARNGERGTRSERSSAAPETGSQKTEGGMRSFPITYTWNNGANSMGTAAMGASQRDAERRFARQHPHVCVIPWEEKR